MTVSLDQHCKIMPLSCAMLPSGNITRIRGVIFQCWPRHQSIFVSGLARYILPIYIIDIYNDIYRIYIRYFCLKISDIFDIFNFYGVFKIFLMWHIVTMFWFSICVFCWLMTCALSIFSVLDNFCQISPLHRNAVLITRVLHLICNAHKKHIIIW